MTPFPPLTIGHLTAPVPIIQGGMGVGISLSGLASAVAEEGGIGVIAAVMVGMDEPDLRTNFREANIRAFRREIRTAREKTRGILGVNIMVALTNYADFVKTALEEGIDLIISGAGLPLDLPGFLKEGMRTRLAPIVSSGRAANILIRKWLSRFNYLPDALVVEGPKAGGHLGFHRPQIDDETFALEKLVPEVVEAVRPFEQEHGRPIPIIAAGGVFTGGDIRHMLELGAAGVQMGTRFVATHECDAAQGFKDAYVDSTEGDLEVIDSPVGLPGRALGNQFLKDVKAGQKKPFTCVYKCLKTCDMEHAPYCIALALINAKKGRLNQGFAFAGANVHRVKEIVPVRQLMRTLAEEFEASAPASSPAV